MVTFVQEIYALATCFLISNISVVTGKTFLTHFWGVIFFVNQNVVGPNFFRPKLFQGVVILWTKIFLEHTFIDQNFFRPQFFSDPKIYGAAILLDQNFFRLIICLGPYICLRQGDFHWRRGLNPDHYRHKSCCQILSYRGQTYIKMGYFFARSILARASMNTYHERVIFTKVHNGNRSCKCYDRRF